MNLQKLCIKLGAGVILFAVLLRILGGVLLPAAQVFQPPKLSGTWMIRQKGGFVQYPHRVQHLPERMPVRPDTKPTCPAQPETNPGIPSLPTAPAQPTVPPATERPVRVPVFGPADMSYVSVTYSPGCAHRPNLEELLREPLKWKLDSDKPAVLIVHTHSTECYTRSPGESYTQTAMFRTLDKKYNMVSIGDALTALLEAGGVHVIHDRQIHDYPSYNTSYQESRRAVAAYLEEYPSIRLVLDLHRDAMENADGTQFATGCTVNGEKAAQLMLVLGTEAADIYHPRWQQNLAMALKLQALMEKNVPGITRHTILRSARYNQDLSPGSILVEVGAAGNTHEEALRAVPVLAEAILALVHGANLY